MDEKNGRVYPTVTSVMWHPTPELRERWLNQYGKDRFSFEEALYAQTFPRDWLFPPTTTKKWKWLAEAFPPKVAEHLFNIYVKDSGLVLLDLFAGIGGWGLGAVWSKKFKKIIMVEIDKEKCSYLKMNFEKLGIDFEVMCSDVREVSEIKADIITASPPCEDLTILRFFSGNKINKGTVPLTIYTLEYVNRVKPATAFYENVYSKVLTDILRRYGWYVERFDMSKIIPQKRVRLIGIKQFKNRLLI
jgi:site-specific DNA-cytosine methylase